MPRQQESDQTRLSNTPQQGSQAVRRAESGLWVGSSDDALEHDADRVTDMVVRRLHERPSGHDQGPEQHECGRGCRHDSHGVQRVHRLAEPDHPRRQPVGARNNRPPIRRAAAEAAPIGPEGGAVEPEIAQRIRRASSGGSPLEPTTRHRMESAFGADFGAVRVHSGSESESVNRALGARAFTTGSHVFLGRGAPTPGSEAGDRLMAHELTHTLQQQGNATGRRIARSALVQREVTFTSNPLYESAFTTNPLYEGASTPEFPKVGNVLGEAVLLENDSDEFEAYLIMTSIESMYGISINSEKLSKAIKAQYTRAPKDVRAALTLGVWQMKELRALDRALAHYAPILGALRKDSTRGKSSQEVKYIGKVKKAISRNSPAGVLDSTTLGEYFRASKTFGMFDAGTNSKADFADSLKQLEATAVHEMAHGLFGHEVKAWADHFEFWDDQYTESGTTGAEAPPSKYGKTNAAEDLCESVMFFFVDEARLRASSPLRHAYIARLVAAWKKTETTTDKKSKR